MIKKGYWYCTEHDDAFFMLLTNDQDIYNLNWSTSCCLKTKECQLEYIGYRLYNNNNILLQDHTVPQKYYDFCAGGFEKEYLANVEKINLINY